MVNRAPCIKCGLLVAVTEFCDAPDCPVYAAFEYIPPEKPVSTDPVVERRDTPVRPIVADIFRK